LLSAFNFFAIERLDDVDAFNDVHHTVAFLFTILSHVSAPSLQSSGLSDGYPNVNGYDEKGGEADIEVGGKHQNQCEDGTHEQRQKVDEEVLYGGREAAYPLVDSCLQFARFVVLSSEEGHAVGEHVVDDGLRKVLGYVDTHLFAKIVLGISDDGRQYFLSEQDDADDGQYVGCFLPFKIVRHDEVVDGIDSTVEHYGIDLGDE